MDMFNAVISCCTIFPTAMLCFAPMLGQLRCSVRSLVLRMAVILIVLTAVGAFLRCSFSLSPSIVTIPTLFILFTVYHLHLKVHISKSLAIFSYVCALMSVISNVSSAIDALLYPELGASSPSIAGSGIKLGLSILLAAFLVYPMYKRAGFLINNMDLRKVWYIGALISGIMLVVNLGMMPHKYSTLYVNNVFRSLWTH